MRSTFGLSVLSLCDGHANAENPASHVLMRATVNTNVTANEEIPFFLKFINC